MNTNTSRVGAFLRAIGLLASIAVVVPWLLVRAATARFGGGAPWSALPPIGEWRAADIGSALTDRLSESTLADIVIRASLAVAWVAVIVVLLTVVTEVVHMLRHGGLSMPDVRGLGMSQRVARVIAAGLLVVVPMFASSSPATADHHPLRLPEGRAPAEQIVRPDNAWIDNVATGAGSHTTTPAPRGDPSPIPLPADQASAGASTYVVRPGDSIWAIAERHAGPDAHAIADYADQLLELNLGLRMDDGRMFTNAAYIDVGWVLRLPDGAVAAPASPSATGRHVVERGETLWSIADDELGEGERWPEIFDANEGRTFDDGRRLTDPDLIQPGWTLDLPGADGAPDGSPDEPAVDPAVEPAVTDAVPPTGDDPTRDVATADGVIEVVSHVDAMDARPDNEWIVRSEVRSDVPDMPDAVADVVDSQHAATPSPLSPDRPSDGGDEVASGVRLLTFERAAMLSAGVLTLLAVRRRNRMRRARPNTSLPTPTRAAVSTERALRSIGAGDRFARLDIAIRAAGLTLIDHGARVEAAVVAPDGNLELFTTSPVELGPPWSPSDAPGTRPPGTCWELPAGTPVELLADDARRVGAPCPTLVQLGRDLDDRDVYVDLEALEALEIGGPGDQADAVVAAIASTLAASVLAEVTTLVGVGVPDAAFLGHRLHRPVRDVQRAFEAAADAIGTTAAADRSTFELRARVTSGEAWEPAVILAGSAVGTVTPPQRRTGLAVVSASPIHGPSSRLAPDGDGWSLLPIGLRLVPVGLTPRDVAAIDALVCVPEPEPAGWSAEDDRTMPPFDPDHVEYDGSAHDAGERDGRRPDREPTIVAQLDHSLVVRLFGPVSVESADGEPVEFERSKTTELIAWLATHRDRSTRSNARSALWELDVRDATFSNVVSEARRAMARCVEPPDGEEWVGRTMTDALPLHPLVVTDLDLVEHALAAARLQPPDLAIETLRPALRWIVGVPFEGTAYLWPDAEGVTSQLVLRAITLTNALADHCLSVGDVDGVFEATSHGLRVLPAHEEMIAVRMRAYAQIGDRAGVRHEWESYERAIVSDPWSDGEPSERMLDLRRELL